MKKEIEKDDDEEIDLFASEEEEPSGSDLMGYSGEDIDPAEL